MIETRALNNTNVLLYLLSEDSDKADQPEEILSPGGTISVHALNEMANVAHRKLAMLPWVEIKELSSLIQSLCSIEPLNLETHKKAILVAERYKLSLYDAMIVATGLIGGCEILYSEDMHDGLLIDNQLRICNPFTSHWPFED